MIKELKDKWIAALRSGEYKQGQRLLKSRREGELRYCCLGVLCEIAEIPSLPDESSPNDLRFNGDVGWLNEPNLTMLGMYQGDARHLAQMNDSGSSFEEIARWIEANING